MFVEPGVQVKPVKHTATTETDFWHFQLIKQGHPDPEVDRSLFLGQATNRGQRQTDIVHVSGPLIAACTRYRPPEASSAWALASDSCAGCIRASAVEPSPGRADRR